MGDVVRGGLGEWVGSQRLLVVNLWMFYSFVCCVMGMARGVDWFRLL